MLRAEQLLILELFLQVKSKYLMLLQRKKKTLKETIKHSN